MEGFVQLRDYFFFSWILAVSAGRFQVVVNEALTALNRAGVLKALYTQLNSSWNNFGWNGLYRDLVLPQSRIRCEGRFKSILNGFKDRFHTDLDPSGVWPPSLWNLFSLHLFSFFLFWSLCLLFSFLLLVPSSNHLFGVWEQTITPPEPSVFQAEQTHSSLHLLYITFSVLDSSLLD